MIRAATAVFLLVLAMALLPGAGAAASGEAARYSQLAKSEAAFTAAVAAHRRGELERAERGYRDAIASDPSFVEAMVNLARVRIAQAELSDATLWLDRAAAGRPEYPEVEAVRGLLALRSGDTAQAVDELAKARAVVPADPEVLTNLAAGLLRQGLADEAIGLLLEARQRDSRSAAAAYNLGLAYDRVGDATRAIHHYRRYLLLARERADGREAVEERIHTIERHRAQSPAAPQIESHSGRTERRELATKGE